MKETLAYFKQGKIINGWHKWTFFYLQVLDLAIRDLMQGDTILELFW
jgi:hypothetical protein